MTTDKDEQIRKKVKHDLESLTTITTDKDEESENSKVLRELLNSENINLKTELSDKEILEIARLEVLNNNIDSDALSSFLLSFKELRVSKNRQGRKEIIGSLQDTDLKKSSGFLGQFVTDLMGKK